ncbi:hypothetical protein GGR57DRAFT_510327 [Xylariaceae sp. FL1272]|nr:hypothetical protein GGR57DRAFT_510327 [Xylariaceae sp. FL1272]
MIYIQQYLSMEHVARSSNRDDSGAGPDWLVAVVFGVVVGAVFLALFIAMHKQWRWERQQALKNKHEEPNEIGKPELPGESSSTVHEMDAHVDAPELGGAKDGLPHELPWKGTIRPEFPEAEFIPQELPASIPQHEMPSRGDILQANKATDYSESSITVQAS